jgi:hypoxanthine phosphoribosyltransferase
MDILLSAETIQKRVDDLAVQIGRDYEGKQLTIVGILSGCVIFLADLVRRLELPLRIAFVQASSYRGATTTPGALTIQSDLLPDLRNRDVLLLDDILDTGQTLRRLVNYLQQAGARSVRTVVLLRKEGRQTVEVEADYSGFTIPDVFVVGYGLDYDDAYRNLPYLAALTEADLQPAAAPTCG